MKIMLINKLNFKTKNIWQVHCLSPIFIAVLALLVTAPGWAANMPAPPQLKAKSYLLGDFNSGQIIVEHSPEEQIEPASITKIMSAYVILTSLAEGAIKLDDEVTISEKAWRMEGSRMFIEVNTQVKVSDLLNGMVIQSGNDATVALAEHVAGTESAFVDLMNNAARSLGMNNSFFVNSTGLPDPSHLMSVRDIFTLATALIRDFPTEYKRYSQKQFTYNKIPQSNRNKLLWQDESVDGIKTGHTNSAGYCLVASAERQGMRLISVLVGADNEKERANQSKALLNYGYRFFETRKLYSKDETLDTIRVWKGNPGNLTLGLREDLFVTYPKGQYDNLKATIDRPDSMVAPVSPGQEVGVVRVSLDDRVLFSRKLYAQEDIKTAGFFRRMIDSVVKMVQ